MPVLLTPASLLALLLGCAVDAIPGLAELPLDSLQVDETVCTLCSAMVSLFMLELFPVVAFPELAVLLDALLEDDGVTCPVTATVWLT